MACVTWCVPHGKRPTGISHTHVSYPSLLALALNMCLCLIAGVMWAMSSGKPMDMQHTPLRRALFLWHPHLALPAYEPRQGTFMWVRVHVHTCLRTRILCVRTRARVRMSVPSNLRMIDKLCLPVTLCLFVQFDVDEGDFATVDVLVLDSHDTD